jgi:DNA-binding response OmpR family regulator
MQNEKLKKYQRQYIDETLHQLKSWEEDSGEDISKEEWYGFLHRMQGTAATIGLPLWSFHAKHLMEQLEAEAWDGKAAIEYLLPLLTKEQNGISTPADLLHTETFILVVSDNSALTSIVKQNLEQEHWVLIAKGNVQQAKAAYERFRPDLIIIDDSLLSEVESTAGFLEEAEARGIPRVLLSDSQEEDLWEEWDEVFSRTFLQTEKWKRRLRRHITRYQKLAHSPVSHSISANWHLAIIDDDEILCNMLYNQFSSLKGVKVTAFREGEAFFNSGWYEQEGHCLIIVDRVMPRMDGFEVVQRLRSLPSSERFVILMLTGKKNEDDIVQALELGVDDYVLKPFRMRELEARVKRLLNRVKP